MVSIETVERFKRLYLEKFNVTITSEEATKMANDLVNLMKVLLLPDPKDNSQINQEGRQDETLTTSS